jgi:23S rRNA-/tRNA-specific pseudouridylate synthase
VTPISTIFEDEHMLVVNKPPGWSIAKKGTGKSATPSLVDALRAASTDILIPAHRLDEEVGGVAVLAKSKPALDFLSGEFQSKQADRLYRGFAVVAREEEIDQVTELPVLREGGDALPAEFEVNYALAPERDQPGRMHVYRKKGGRRAFTRFKVVETFGRFVWFEAIPETNREKQIQAHLAAIGAPVVGDDVHGLPAVRLLLSQFKRGYKGRGEEKPLIRGVALQAARLTLRHPQTKERLTWAAPLPKDFEIALRNLRKFTRRTPPAG